MIDGGMETEMDTIGVGVVVVGDGDGLSLVGADVLGVGEMVGCAELVAVDGVVAGLVGALVVALDVGADVV